MRKAIDSSTRSTTFDEAWDAVAPKFHTLRMFCGGLATVIANNATIESDFSILKWEMDELKPLDALVIRGYIPIKATPLTRAWVALCIA